MINRFLIGLLCCVSCFVYGQSDANKKIDLANDIALDDFPRALEILDKVEMSWSELSEQERAWHGAISMRLRLIEGDYNQARVTVEQVNHMSMLPNHRLQFYLSAIVLNQILEDFVRAFEYLNYAAQIPFDELSKRNKVRLHLVAAELNIDAGTFSHATNWVKKAVSIAKGSNNDRIKCDVLYTQVYLLAKQELFEEARLLLGTATKVCTRVNDMQALSTFKDIQSLIYRERKEYVKQQQILESVLATIGRTTDSFNYYQTILLFAESLVVQNKFSQAKDALAKLDSFFIENELVGDIATVFRLQSAIEEKENDIGQALNSYKHYIHNQELFDIAINKSQLVHLNAQFASANNELQQTLSRRLDERNDAISKANTMRTLCLVVASVIVLISLCLGIAFYNRRQKVIIIDTDKYDDLTSLLTEKYGQKQAMLTIEAGGARAPLVVVIMLEIGQLDMVSQSLSVAHGDSLLEKSALALSRYTIDSDVLFRCDLTMFCVVTQCYSQADALNYVEKLAHCLGDISIKGINRQAFNFNAGWTSKNVMKINTLQDFIELQQQAQCALEDCLILGNGPVVAYSK